MRNLLKVILIGAVVLTIASPAWAANQRPNIVLIMADDVSWECFGCYGATDYQTPNLDRLAAEGVRFRHCYSTPLCTPSRVQIMTGQYSFRNYTHFGYLNPQDRTFGQMLQGAGYKTAIAGKWQLNGLYHQAAGCLDNGRPYQAGFHEYCLWQLTQGRGGEQGGERFWSPPLEQNGQLLTAADNAGKYGPDIMSDFVCDFIRRYQDEPFFVYYPTVLVHDPFVPTPETIGDGDRSQQANKSPKAADARKANFVAMVAYLDKIVGKIVGQLEAVGQLENTLILFTADNGTHKSIQSQWNGQTIAGGKGSTTDMGTHVPLIAYWKGHTPTGAVLDELIDFTDFYPTLADAAGVELGKHDPIDGRSFLPQIQGATGVPRDWVLLHYQPYWGGFPGQQYVRDQQFKLYRDGRFYNVPADLQETHELIPAQFGAREHAARRALGLILEKAPPPPPVKGGPNAKHRPTTPDWRNLFEPHD